MRFIQGHYCKGLLLLFSMLCSGSVLAGTTNDTAHPASLKHGHAVFQLGGFWASQGKAQHIAIDGLIGDDFTVNHNNSSNALVGLGYFFDGQNQDRFKMAYGLNFIYLPKTGVSGTVVQENLFTNLSYGYSVSHYPLYAIAKSTIDMNSTRHAITLEAGIGPDVMKTTGFHEQSLDDGMTLPDHIFSGRTTTTFSAVAGVGVTFNQVFGPAPLECGYRFFYLGQGNFNVLTNQVVTVLNTGTVYANAVMCSITL